MKIEKQTLALQPSIMKDLAKESVIELLERSVDERGLPIFGIIEIENEDGSVAEVYKQEKLFNAEDYRKAALYQAKLASHHKELADYYSAELEKKFPDFSKTKMSDPATTL